MNVTDRGRLFRLWCGLCLAAAALAAVSLLFLDAPIAQYFVREYSFATVRKYAPSSLLINASLAAAGLAAGLLCLFTRRFPRWAEALLLSVAAVIASYYLTDHLMKPLFQRPPPHIYVYHLRNNFGWHRDFGYSNFPSTHAALVGAGLFVAAAYFPQRLALCLFGVVAIDAVMVIGSWHFLSDVAMGNLVGFTMALLACELMAAGKARRPLAAR
jgi:membrane-associated phospholipid phosphatase